MATLWDKLIDLERIQIDAQLGIASAQHDLGVLLALGLGPLEQDRNAAAFWFREASRESKGAPPSPKADPFPRLSVDCIVNITQYANLRDVAALAKSSSLLNSIASLNLNKERPSPALCCRIRVEIPKALSADALDRLIERVHSVRGIRGNCDLPAASILAKIALCCKTVRSITFLPPLVPCGMSTLHLLLKSARNLVLLFVPIVSRKANQRRLLPLPPLCNLMILHISNFELSERNMLTLLRSAHNLANVDLKGEFSEESIKQLEPVEKAHLMITGERFCVEWLRPLQRLQDLWLQASTEIKDCALVPCTQPLRLPLLTELVTTWWFCEHYWGKLQLPALDALLAPSITLEAAAELTGVRKLALITEPQTFHVVEAICQRAAAPAALGAIHRVR